MKAHTERSGEEEGKSRFVHIVRMAENFVKQLCNGSLRQRFIVLPLSHENDNNLTAFSCFTSFFSFALACLLIKINFFSHTHTHTVASSSFTYARTSRTHMMMVNCFASIAIVCVCVCVSEALMEVEEGRRLNVRKEILATMLDDDDDAADDDDDNDLLIFYVIINIS